MEEYSPEFSNLPDIGSLLQQRVARQSTSTSPQTPTAGFDPHKLMVKKRKVETGEELPEIPEDPKWPEEDVKALQDYCAKMGIVGFSTRQHPKLALMQLKQQVGDYSDVPLECRIPMGYEKAGTLNSNSANFPYSRPPQIKKTLLNG